MSTRMTASRLARLIAAGDADAVRRAVAAQPRLLTVTVERNGQDGWTPMHLAVAAGDTTLVETLGEAGADLAAQTGDGRTPLHVAVRESPGMVPVLRRLGAPVDAGTAAFLGDASLLTRALDDAPEPAGEGDLLACAAAGGSVGTVQVLLERGAAPAAGALHAAAAAGAAPVVRLLLQSGADVDGRDRDTGRTPLHTAVAALSTDPGDGAGTVVPLLIDAGADVNATTSDGASALDIAHVVGARRRAARPLGAGADTEDADALSRLLVAAGATG